MTATTGNNPCCPDCRLRFAAAEAAYLIACPECGEPLQPLADLSEAVGFRLFRLGDAPQPMPEAIAVAIPIPDPGSGRVI